MARTHALVVLENHSGEPYLTDATRARFVAFHATRAEGAAAPPGTRPGAGRRSSPDEGGVGCGGPRSLHKLLARPRSPVTLEALVRREVLAPGPGRLAIEDGAGGRVLADLTADGAVVVATPGDGAESMAVVGGGGGGEAVSLAEAVSYFRGRKFSDRGNAAWEHVEYVPSGHRLSLYGSGSLVLPEPAEASEGAAALATTTSTAAAPAKGGLGIGGSGVARLSNCDAELARLTELRYSKLGGNMSESEESGGEQGRADQKKEKKTKNLEAAAKPSCHLRAAAPVPSIIVSIRRRRRRRRGRHVPDKGSVPHTHRRGISLPKHGAHTPGLS